MFDRDFYVAIFCLSAGRFFVASPVPARRITFNVPLSIGCNAACSSVLNGFQNDSLPRLEFFSTVSSGQYAISYFQSLLLYSCCPFNLFSFIYTFCVVTYFPKVIAFILCLQALQKIVPISLSFGLHNTSLNAVIRGNIMYSTFEGLLIYSLHTFAWAPIIYFCSSAESSTGSGS